MIVIFGHFVGCFSIETQSKSQPVGSHFKQTAIEFHKATIHSSAHLKLCKTPARTPGGPGVVDVSSCETYS